MACSVFIMHVAAVHKAANAHSFIVSPFHPTKAVSIALETVSVVNGIG
jgi:hypothetical protein